MLYRKMMIVLLLVFPTGMVTSSAQAGVFGEVALSVGGTFPQGTFTRYADPGISGLFRTTLHIPKVEMFAAWIDIGAAGFSTESEETFAETPAGRRFDVNRSTSEHMYCAHVGLQLATMTRRAFFRPRGALGIGVYNFNTTISWTMDQADTTITLDTETEDSQTSFGWRGLLGADFFVTTQLGVTADFIYDHVFKLNQTHSPQQKADLTSRFHGFSVGIVYMFFSK